LAEATRKKLVKTGFYLKGTVQIKYVEGDGLCAQTLEQYRPS